MSYQVFARKYRPQTFKEVVGQDHVTQTLANAIARNRLAHAFLFVGPRGTGKTSTARIFAKSLNCANGPTIEPCGVCDACVEIARGNSLDVLEIDGASNNGVEQVRELRENARFAPARDRFKIYIIDEVHMLTTSAFNALLKTLEEPPAHVKFIFATTEVHKVLPTILSRCQRFDMRRIPSTLIAAHLLQIAAQEKIELSAAAAATIARAADGGMRDAESMLDQLAAFCGGEINDTDVMSVFGITPMRQVAALSGAILARDTPTALDLIKEHDQSGRDLSRLLDDLIQHLRALLVVKVNPGSALEEIDPEAREVIEAQAADVSSARIMELIEQFASAEGRMRWAPNKRLHFEVAIVRAVQYLGQTTLDEVLEAAATGGSLAIEPATPHPPASGQPSGSPSGRAPSAAPPSASVSARASAPQTPSPGVAPVQAAAAPKHAPDPTVAVPAPAAAPSAQMAEDAAPPRSASTSVPADSSATGLWQKICSIVESQRPLLAQWVRAGSALSVDQRTLRVGFSPEDKPAKESLSRPNAKAFMKTIIETAAGRPLDLVLELSNDVQRNTEEDPLASGLKDHENDPLIIDAVQRFEARRLDT